MITLKEQYLYGSKRLGVRKPHVQLAAAPHTAVGYQTPNEPQAPGGWFNNDCMCYTYEEPVPVGGTPPPSANTTFTARFYTHTLGKKEYELTNHASAPLSASLGNVLATVLDRKTGVKASPTATTYAWFKADVSTAQDYYPFGSLMPGRTYVAPTGAGYRFGFQGQERDDEVYGKGNAVNYKYRMQDTRIGRFFAVDPLAAYYPWNSPYAFAENKVIQFIELEGLEIALPRILPRVYLPRPALTLPRIPVQPIHPIPPIVPTTPQVPNQPGSPSLPNASNSESIRWEDIDMTNTDTWPRPPGAEGELTPGDPSRNKPRERGEKSLYDEKGGEYRPMAYPNDKYHPKPRWKYKPPGNNTEWEDIFIETLPPVVVYPRPPAENEKEYKKQMKQYEKEMKKYEKEKERYYKECGCEI